MHALPMKKGLGEVRSLAAYDISVVIPVHNRWDLLSTALHSVLEQTYTPHEIIVVDDGSDSPVTPELKERFPQVQFIRQTNGGVANARNNGIKKSTGSWIALLDSDDQWEKIKLEKQVALLLKHSGLLAVHTGEKWIRNGNEVITPNYLDKSSNNLWQRSLKNCLICASSVLLHRTLFDEIGWFDQSLPVCEDYDFWLRLLLHTELRLVDKNLVNKHGGHPDQLSTTTWGMDRYRVQSLEKILTSSSLPQDQEDALISTLAEKLSILANGAAKRGKMEQAKQYQKVLQKYQPTSLRGNEAPSDQ
jgi:glycosyltransferase involved in cell wall biosynthesis